MLGNTPAVARRAYIDPRVFDSHLSGWAIRTALENVDDLEAVHERARRRTERAVLDLLAEDDGAAALRQIAA
jgi:DNA topoisomerase I